MGTELAKHLIANNDYEVRVWNRTLDKTTPLVDAGATAYPTAAEAVTGADVVITALFGPKTVRNVVIEPDLIPAGIPWIDTTTVSPQDAEEFAANVSTYIACPVVGTLGRPAPENLVCTWAAPIRSCGSWLPALYPPGRTRAG